MSIISNLLDKYESQAFENRYSRSTSLRDEDLIPNRNSTTLFSKIPSFPETIVVPLKDTDVIIHIENENDPYAIRLAGASIGVLTPDLNYEKSIVTSNLSDIGFTMNALSKLSLNDFLIDGPDSTPDTISKVVENTYHKNSKNTWEKDIKSAKIKDTYFPYFW